MILSATEARGIFTKELVAVYKEQNNVMSFLRSFFNVVESDTRYLSTEIERGTEYIAVDVLRGTGANRNTVSKSTEKLYEPPMYHEDFDATELDFYDQLFGVPEVNVSANTFDRWLGVVAEKMMKVRSKIERAYELQASQALTDGIVQLKNGDNIDFKRKAESLIDAGGDGGYWTDNTTDPLDQVARWCKFLREQGKIVGTTVNMICGDEAKRALFGNTNFKEDGDLRRLNFMDIRPPQQNAQGAATHGVFSAGDYNVNVWTYPEVYQDPATGNLIPYLDPKKVIIIPESPSKFIHGFAAVPLLYRDRNNAEFPQYITNQQAQYVLGNYVDEAKTAHVFDIKSAGLCMPVSVDQIVTAQVVG